MKNFRSSFRPVLRRTPNSACRLLASHNRLTSSDQGNRSTPLRLPGLSQMKEGVVLWELSCGQKAKCSFAHSCTQLQLRLCLYTTRPYPPSQLWTFTTESLTLLFCLVLGFHGGPSSFIPLGPLLLVYWAFKRFQVFAQLLIKVPLLDKLTISQGTWCVLKSSKNVNCYIMFLVWTAWFEIKLSWYQITLF